MTKYKTVMFQLNLQIVKIHDSLHHFLCGNVGISAKYVVEVFERGGEEEVYLKVNITISWQGKQPEAALAARQRRDYTQASGL